MRIPNAWNDRRLLYDEPFRTNFYVFSTADTSRSNTSEIQKSIQLMAMEVWKHEKKAAEQWVQIAFATSPRESQRHEIVLTEETCLVFVQLYWELYKHENDMGQPWVFLCKKRLECGYEYQLSGSSGSSDAAANRIEGIAGSYQRKHTRMLRANAVTKRKVTNGRASKPRKRAGFEGSALQIRPRACAEGRNAKRSVRITIPPILKARSSLPSGALWQQSFTHVAQPRHKEEETPRRMPSIILGGQQSYNILTRNTLPSLQCPIPVLPARSPYLHITSNGPAISRTPRGPTIKNPMSVQSRFICTFPTIGPSSSHCQTTPEVDIEYARIIPPTTYAPSNGWAMSLPPESDTNSVKMILPATHAIDTLFLNGPSILPCQTLHDGIRNAEIIPRITDALCSRPLIQFPPEVHDGVRLYQPHYDTHPKDVAVAPKKKPPLEEYPPMWAKSRQEICESFDWFRSYQGGVYHVNDFVKGYLLSAFSASRDCFEQDGRLIISHGGGKAESLHNYQGKSILQPAEDQRAEDKSVRALLTNYRESRPLVLLIDDKYALFPYDIGAKDVTYAVLGFYTISHAWAEYQPAQNVQGRVIRYKFAFQWCMGQGDPWWLTKKKGTHQQSPVPLSKAPMAVPPVKVRSKPLLNTLMTQSDISFWCSFCKETTPKVYKQAWVCLNPSCTHFWVMPDGNYLGPAFQYNPDFLRSSTPYVLPPNLRDPFVTLRVSVSSSIDTTYASTRGLHCRNCGRLSCRFKWEYWECSHCKDTIRFHGKLRHAKEFWNEKLPVSFIDDCVHKHSGIITEAPKLFRCGKGTSMGQVQTFVLPNDRGRIHHIKSTNVGGDEEADAIFEAYQVDAMTERLQFRRWPMRAHKCRGPLLTNYFSQNTGEPYHYVGGTANTVPFDRASTAVIRARDLIEIRIQEALSIKSQFNEVLSAAYMERQRMAFHSDSEEGLGPLVAGLSLGAPAVMHFRLHSRYIEGTSSNKSSIVLSVILRHGDVLVMDGAEVQEYYEHTVVPSNFRIAATARRIDPAPKPIHPLQVNVLHDDTIVRPSSYTDAV